MGVAAAKVLRVQFERMLSHEPGARKGEDPEEVHQMRVATRRMRAALLLFKDHVASERVGPIGKRVRELATTLGLVRDLDVYLEGVERYRADLGVEQAAGLEPLCAAVARERTASQERLVAYLDRRRYLRLQKALRRLIDEWAAAEGGATVAEVAPGAVWDRYRMLLDKGAGVVDGSDLAALHAVRIGAKKLRYSLEFFRDAFGEPAVAPIEELKAAQDHLGELNDCLVATVYTSSYLSTGSLRGPGRRGRAVVLPGAADYLAYGQRRAAELASSFPAWWQRLAGSEFHDSLQEAIR